MASKYAEKKGIEAEEALRAYFNSIGYFTARGVPFEHSGYTLTDVDLFLYQKESSIARSRANVDIKRKKTPQAMERIFWAKGLQQVLGMDFCVVATTDKRHETIQFGRAHDVVVLDGRFMQRVLSYSAAASSRVEEEEFVAALDTPSIVLSNSKLKSEYEESKKALLTRLDFNGCNALLAKLEFTFQEYLARQGLGEPALRLLYVVVAYFLVSLDYVSRQFSYRSLDERKEEMAEGFRYGESGRARVEEISKVAISLVEQSTSGDLFLKGGLAEEIERQLTSYPAGILVEHFAKPDIQKDLFDQARAFEALAFSTNLVEPTAIKSNLKGTIAVLCDFLGIDRKQVI